MVEVTERAGSRIRELMQDTGAEQELYLRVAVRRGGCSGFSYGLALDDQIAEEDAVYDSGGVRVVLDALAQRVVGGSQIDYVDDVMGGGFAIHNPRAVRTCGCGSSFQVAEEEGSPEPC